MKKFILCMSFGILLTNAAIAQLENKGWWTRDLFSFQYFHQNESLADNRLERTYNRYYTQPEIGYVINKRLLLGIVTQYENITDRYVVPVDRSSLLSSTKHFYGAGPLFRYYFPLTKKASFMPEVYSFFSKQTNTDVFSDFGQQRKVTTSRTEFGLGANPTIVYFLTKNMAFSITVVNIGYYASKVSQSFSISINPQQWLFGIEFYFDKKKAENLK